MCSNYLQNHGCAKSKALARWDEGMGLRGQLFQFEIRNSINHLYVVQDFFSMLEKNLCTKLPLQTRCHPGVVNTVGDYASLHNRSYELKPRQRPGSYVSIKVSKLTFEKWNYALIVPVRNNSRNILTTYIRHINPISYSLKFRNSKTLSVTSSTEPGALNLSK